MIVGIDDSPDALNALAWAVANSDVLGRVTPVTTHHLPLLLGTLIDRGWDLDAEAWRMAAERHLATAIASLDPEHRVELTSRGRVVEARPGQGLCALAAGADLLVVGSRGRSGLTASLLGSVSSYCVRHATVPVAVVPPEHEPSGPLARVAVGIDGSASAMRALRWALDHTHPDGRVIAVGAAPMWGFVEGGGGGERVEAQLLQLVEHTVTDVIASRATGPDVEIWTDRRDARVALRDLPGPPADMLVVGARGLSELPFLLLGSVSSALVHHPLIPTVVVRTDPSTQPERESP